MKSIFLSAYAALWITCISLPGGAAGVTPTLDSRNGDECRAQVHAIYDDKDAKPTSNTYWKDLQVSRELKGCAAMDSQVRYRTINGAIQRLLNAKQTLQASHPVAAELRWEIAADNETILKLSDGHDRDSYLLQYKDYARYASTAATPDSPAQSANQLYRCSAASGQLEFSQQPCAPGSKQTEEVAQKQSVGPAPSAALCARFNADIAASQQKHDATINALLSMDTGHAQKAVPGWRDVNTQREESLLDLEWQKNRARAAGCAANPLIDTAPAPQISAPVASSDPPVETAGRLQPGGNYLNFHRGATVTLFKDGGLLVYGNGVLFDDATAHAVHTDILRSRFHQANLQPPDPSPNYWDPVRHGWRKLDLAPECASAARYLHTATALPDGKVLIAGGLCDLPKFANDPGPYPAYASLSLWDPVSRKWLNAPPLQHARIYHSASLMPDGGVIIVGGESDPALWVPSEEPVLDSVELYAHDTVTALPPLNQARAMHTTTVLGDGSVMVTGGFNGEGHALASVETWSPATRAWRALPKLHEARYDHTATLLADGRIVITGGVDIDGKSLPSVEIWHPDRQEWSVGPELPVALHGHAAALLTSGQILVTGGAPAAIYLKPVPWAWTLDANSSEWNLAGNVMQSNNGELAGNITLAARADGSATVFTNHLIMRWEPVNSAVTSPSPVWHSRPAGTQLSDDRVMWVGYQIGNPGSSPPTAHIWDPKSDTWTSAGRLNRATWFDEIRQLASGRVIHVGLDGDRSFFCESWENAGQRWNDCGTGALGYASLWRVELGALPDGRAFFIANRHEVLVFDEARLSWAPWQIEWNTEDLAFGAPIRSAKPFARILDPANGQGYEINDAGARFWSRSTDRPPPDMLWNSKTGLWDFIFQDQKISSQAHYLPDGCAISIWPSSLFNPATGKVTGLTDPGFGVDVGQFESLVLRDGTVVVAGVSPGAKDSGSGFFHRKASCAGYEKIAGSSTYISGGTGFDGIAPVATVAPAQSNPASWIARAAQVLSDYRWLLLACTVSLLVFLLSRRLRLKRLQAGPSWTVRLFIGGLCLVFLVPAIWKYVQFHRITTTQACADNAAACLVSNSGILKSNSDRQESSIPCHMVGVWSSRRESMMRRIELKDDGTYAMESAHTGMDLPGGYTGHWAVQGQNMVWRHDQSGSDLDINKILPHGDANFTLIEANGSQTNFELIRQVASTRCTP